MAGAIVVTGTPGTGKSSASRLLAGSIGYEYIDLSDLISKEKLYGAIDRLRGSKIADMAKVRKRLRQLIADSPKGAIIDGHIADAAPRENVETVIVLRLHPVKLKHRLELLGWPEEKVKENVSCEVLDVCLKQAIEFYGFNIVKEIDTTDKSPAQVCELIVEALKCEDRFKPGDVDWLQIMEQDETLEGFLAKDS